MSVSVAPRAFAVSRLRWMMASSSVMSARSKWVTCGITVAESVMRSAMVRRRCDSGWRSTAPHCSKFGSGGSVTCVASGFPGAVGAAGSARAARGGVVVGALTTRPDAASTSSSVTRPPGPVARTAWRSTPSSRARRRVAGVAGTGPGRAGARGGSGGAAWRARPSCTVVRGSGASVRVGSSVSAACLPLGVAFATCAPASAKVTRTCPTFTV